MSCSTCVHHQMREMISKPYGYVGDIPCLRCSRLKSNDEYVPMNGTFPSQGNCQGLNMTAQQTANPDKFILDSVKGIV